MYLFYGESKEASRCPPGSAYSVLDCCCVCTSKTKIQRDLRAQRGCLCMHTRVDTRSPGNDGVSQEQGVLPLEAWVLCPEAGHCMAPSGLMPLGGAP